MTNETRTAQIIIAGLTEAQAMALEDMLAYWMDGGAMGCSRWTSFFADGDGNFRPVIVFDGRRPQHQTLVDPGKFWTRDEPWKGDYRIDFDVLAWALDK